MHATFRVLSYLLSILLYPLFIPTYGMLLFCIAFTQYYAPLPVVHWLVAMFGTFFLTAIIPLTSIMLLMKQGRVRNIHIDDAKERTTPYIYTIVCFAFWTYFLFSVLKAPYHLTLTAAGAAVALGIVTLINRHWKISAHLTGFGGLTGGIFSFFLAGGLDIPLWLVLTLLVLALLLMYARLYLHAHSSAQVVGGYLLGLAMTFIPNLLFALL